MLTSLLVLLSCVVHSLGNGIEQWYTQKVDHFNPYNIDTFEQKWFYNDSLWGGADTLSPILFIAGGEGAVSGIGYGFVKQLAAAVNGYMVTIEHRFYGESRPYGDIDSYTHTSNRLGLLQVEQAMADYAEFIIDLKSNLGCTECPVAVFGGSYPGELAVFLRMKYPHVFDMALGASAPIFYTSNGLVDPYAFFTVVTDAAARLSPQCPDAVRTGFAALQTASPQKITQKIPLCDELSSNVNEGLYELEAYLFETFANLAMGNYPPATSSFTNACARMLSGDMSDGLGIISRLVQPYFNDNNCLDLIAEKPAGANATIHCSDLSGCGNGLGGESWDFQACAQNIEPMATNGVTDMFTVWDWDMDWLDYHCQSRFGIKASNRQHWMRDEFGLDSLDTLTKSGATRIIFSNGKQDPWHAGGVMESLSDSLIAVVMENGAHHSDMRGPDVNDTADVVKGRQMETDILKQWIAEVQEEQITFLDSDGPSSPVKHKFMEAN